MRTRTALAAALLALAAATASCSSNNDSADKPRATASAVNTSASAGYTEADCVALLEENYTTGTPQDVSEEPECAALTEDEYADLVGQVLTGHKDEILDDAKEQTAWDMAWDELDANAQDNICSALWADDPVATESLPEEQAQYFLDNKC